MTSSTMKNKHILPHIKILKIIFSIVVILSIWEVIALIVNDGYFLPDVIDTCRSLGQILLSGTFFKVVFTAFYRVISGLFIGIISGIFIAALCYKYDLVKSKP